MSDRPIQVGDLVMIVKGGCRTDNIGKVFKVARLGSLGKNCPMCGTTHGFPMGTPLASDKTTGNIGFEFPRLKRIEPPQFGDSLPTRADIKEPA